MTLDGYNQTYDAGETSEVTIDLIVKVLAALVSLGALIGLIILFGWMKKNIPRI